MTEWLRGKPKISPIKNTTSMFYATLLKNWIPLHSYPQVGEAEIRNEPLWLNKFIGPVLQDPILRERWKEAGITRVQDVCHPEEGRLLSHKEIQDRFHVRCTFLEALQLRMAVPLHWRTALTRGFASKGDHQHNIRIRPGVTLPIKSTSSIKLYSELMALKKGIIRNQQRWEASIDVAGPC